MGAVLQLRVGDDAVQRPFELADVLVEALRQLLQNFQRRVVAAQVGFLPEDGEAGLEAGGLYVGDEAALQPRADAVPPAA